MHDRWGNAAEIRRDQIESGLDITFNEVFKPVFVAFAKMTKPSSAMEIGAGTGALSLAMCDYIQHLVAVEPSSGMCAVAEEVLAGTHVRLLKGMVSDLPETDRYDIAFSHLVAHCVGDFPDLLRSIRSRLVDGGQFLFSIPHPCFYNDYKDLFGDQYRYMSLLSREVSFCITKDKARQIEGVPYYHRPLSYYINGVTSAGLLLERFEEIYPDEELQAKYGAPWTTPRYCTFLCKRPPVLA